LVLGKDGNEADRMDQYPIKKNSFWVMNLLLAKSLCRKSIWMILEPQTPCDITQVLLVIYKMSAVLNHQRLLPREDIIDPLPLFTIQLN
jgi:hypothetical protein